MAAEIYDLPDPTYIDSVTLLERTRMTGIDALDDEDVTLLIQTAEEQIDAYVGPQRHHLEDTNVLRVFPRYEDTDSESGAVIIPAEVTMATLRQVEWLFEQWWSTRATQSQPTDHAKTNVNVGSDGSYSEQRTHKGLDFAGASLCEQAKALLSRLKSGSGEIMLSNPRPENVPTSSRDFVDPDLIL